MSASVLKKAIAGLCLISFAGCAAGYHAYPDGCVPYTYCVPAPLPYTQYSSCPTPIAARYLERRADTIPSPPVLPMESEDQTPTHDSIPQE